MIENQEVFNLANVDKVVFSVFGEDLIVMKRIDGSWDSFYTDGSWVNCKTFDLALVDVSVNVKNIQYSRNYGNFLDDYCNDDDE